MFGYIYFAVGRFELVKSKSGLAIAAMAMVFSAMSMAVGLCTRMGLATTVTAVEIIPFLVAAIGLDNMTIIAKVLFLYFHYFLFLYIYHSLVL